MVFGFHLLGDTESVEDTREMDSAGAAFRRISMDDRFGGEQRTLERIDRSHAWTISRQARSCEAKRSSIGLDGVGQFSTPI